MLLLVLTSKAEACACCDATTTIQREVVAQDAEANQLVRQKHFFCGGLRYAWEVWPLDATAPETCLRPDGRPLACDAPGSLVRTDARPEATEAFAYASPIGVRDVIAKDHSRHRLYDTQLPDWGSCRPAGGSGAPIGSGDEGVLVESLAWSCEQTWRRYEVHTGGLDFRCVDTDGETTACATAWTTDEADLSEAFGSPMFMAGAGATFTNWEGGGWTVTDRMGTVIVERRATD